MKKLLLSATLLSVSLTGLAYDEATAPWNRHIGSYVEATLGTNLCFLSMSSGDSSFPRAVGGLGLSAAYGYQFNHWFALEGGLLFSTADTTRAEDQEHHHVNVNAPYITTRFTAPIGERASFFAKLGLMYPNSKLGIDMKDNIGIVLPFAGVGASYAVTPKLDLNVQYQGAVYAVANAGVLSGGLTYHF